MVAQHRYSVLELVVHDRKRGFETLDDVNVLHGCLVSM
jgi:hypothetical protein